MAKAIIQIMKDGSRKLVRVEGATSMTQCESVAAAATKGWKIESEEVRPEDVTQEQQSDLHAET